MDIGDRIISDLLRENHDKYILADPSGWLSDLSFIDACKEYGIILLSLGEPTENNLSDIRTIVSKEEHHQIILVLVRSRNDADSWQHLLGPHWRMKDIQPSSIFPSLDPEISKHLSYAQATRVLAELLPDHPVLSPRKSAETILEILFGIKAEKLTDLNYFLESAIALHLKGQIPDRSWLDAIPRSFPSIPFSKVSPKEALTSFDAFTELVEDLISTGRISPKIRTKLQQIASGSAQKGDALVSLPEQLGLDPLVIKDQVRKISWDCTPLISWLERSQILSKLSLSEELFKDPELITLRAMTEIAFCKVISREYFKLQQSPWHFQPPMVHRILPFINAHNKNDKVALVIIDCLPISFWQVIRLFLENRFSLVPASEGSTFAWIPTLTSVSRQSIFSAGTPADLGELIQSTYREEKWWQDFWLERGFQKDAIRFINVAEKRKEDIQTTLLDQDIRRLALIFNDIDELVHSTTSISTLDTQSLLEIMDNWVSVSLGPILKDLLHLGWAVFMTSDHGAQRMRQNIGNIREGVLTERAGQRARIYSRSSFAVETKSEGILWDGKGTLPQNYIALLAPPGTGYGYSFGWGHGGASWEEVIVPFVKFEGIKS